MFSVKSYAALDAQSPLAPFALTRRDPGDNDVQIALDYCGVCHSDLHQARNEWGNSLFPMVPGHEMIGRVEKTGKNVTRFKAGDLVGVGCLVDSCRHCAPCQKHLEQFCENTPSFSYNGFERDMKTVTQGGYSQKVTVNQDFVLSVPAHLDPASAAPLLCAGITTFSPLRHWKVGRGMKVGIIGLGGLGHMGVKLARAMEADTYVFTTSPAKKKDAQRLGATDAILSTDDADMKKHAGSFDFILNTVAAPHNINPYFSMLKIDGTLTMVGVPDKPLPVSVDGLIFGRRNFAGSLIGGIAETQEMLNFCGAHNIVADVEVIGMGYINEAYERMLKNDVRYRFSIDLSTLEQ